MPLNLKSQFAKRIERFFKIRKIYIDIDKAEELIEYLYIQFKHQGRLKEEDKPFYVTPKFVIGAVSNFLKINPSMGLELFRDFRTRRSNVKYNYSDLEFRLPEQASKGLISLLGRKHKPQYKLTKTDGTSLTPHRMTKAKEYTSAFDVGFSPLALLSKNKKARKRAVSADDSRFADDPRFELDMASSEMALWRKMTPQKNAFFSPNRVVISKLHSDKEDEPVKKLSFAYDADSKKGTIELFEFTVTQEDILERIDAKRPVSQKKAMGDVSALEIMQALGVIVTEKQSGRNFHLAHRRGWSLKGEQSKENLDPMTAGSNYDTLFKIEAPLKKILLDQEVDEVYVKGGVEFDNDSGLPFKVTYNLSWGTMDFIEVVIDPMSHRVPTVDEHEVAKSFFSLAVD